MFCVCHLQLTVQASDGRGRISNAAITINIERDQQPPKFEGAPYRPGQVSENARARSGVYTVRAVDPDMQVYNGNIPRLTNTVRAVDPDMQVYNGNIPRLTNTVRAVDPDMQVYNGNIPRLTNSSICYMVRSCFPCRVR